MSAWQPLRDYLRADAERFVDGIMTDPATDARARAYLAVHRERVVDQLADKAELATLHKFLGDDERELMRLITSEAPCETMQ